MKPAFDVWCALLPLLRLQKSTSSPGLKCASSAHVRVPTVSPPAFGKLGLSPPVRSCAGEEPKEGLENSRRNAGGLASPSSTLKPTLGVWQLSACDGRSLSSVTAILRWTFQWTKETKERSQERDGGSRYFKQCLCKCCQAGTCAKVCHSDCVQALR